MRTTIDFYFWKEYRMNKFVFKREPKLPKIKRQREPIILEDWEKQFDAGLWKYILVVFLVMLVVFFTAGVCWRFDPAKKQVEEMPTYTIHYEAPTTKYYDRELDKVLIKEWYKYSEQYAFAWTGSLEWSCVDTECNFASTPEQIDKEFYASVGTRYFIR